MSANISTNAGGTSVNLTLPNLGTGTGGAASTGQSVTLTLPTDHPTSRGPGGDVFTTIPRGLPPLNGGSRVLLSTPLGNVIATLPRGMSPADLLAAFKGPAAAPEVLIGGGAVEVPVSTTLLTVGSQTVFSAAHAQAPIFSGLPANANVSQFLSGHAPAAALLSAGESVYPHHETSAKTLPARAHSESPSGASSTAAQTVRVPSAESARVPEAAKQILSNLGLLPPGIGTDQALPRLQEVLRQWSAGELPAHLAKVVDQVLTSAVLATALVDSAPQLAHRDGETRTAQPGVLGSGLFTPQVGRDVHTGPLTRAQIADAILSALTPSTIPLSLVPQGQTIPVKAAAVSVSPEAQTLPAPANSAANGKAAAADRGTSTSRLDSRMDAMPVRSDAIDRSVRDAKVRLTGDEQHERADTLAEQLDTQRAPHDQESHGNSEEADTHAAEALWNQLHVDLRKAGFVSASGSLRPLEFSMEGIEVLELVASRLPEGWDVIDGLALVDARMGLAPEAGAVNNALYRLASYRKTWQSDKVRAVLEPLHDAFVQLGLVADDIVPVSESDITSEDLKGFQTHLAAAQMIKDNPRWMARLGDEEDRDEIITVLPDVEKLLERANDKLPVSRAPVYYKAAPALLH